jgi:hypothetical protein
MLNALGIDVRQIHKAEPPVHEPSAFPVELATEKLKVTNLQVLIKSQQNMLKAESRKIPSESHKLFISVWNMESLQEEWKESIIVLYLSIRRAKKQIVVIIGVYHFCKIRTKIYPTLL